MSLKLGVRFSYNMRIPILKNGKGNITMDEYVEFIKMGWVL
jgi:hypothetical protein